MNRFLFLLLFYLLVIATVDAQIPADTTEIPRSDSLLAREAVIKRDSLPFKFIAGSISKNPNKDSGWIMNPAISFSSPGFSWQVLDHNPYYGFKTKSTYPIKQDIKQFAGKDILFYLIIFLLVVFGLLRTMFPKYFSDLFRLFFRTTLKQRQIKEQLMQTPLPSLLLNVFFIISTGLYITFLFQYFNINPVDNFWLLFFYCCLGLSAAYLVKFVGLKISGWLFNMPESADAYIFIVFIINKMIGILLLPFLVLLAFTKGGIYSTSLTLSWCLVAGLLGYRFILTFAAVRNQVKVNPFHFLLYLCAFEIVPLLLVYKALLLFFSRTA
ncbi:MAG: DUF4271 domain-containing protein [Bacteroidota bacterium]